MIVRTAKDIGKGPKPFKFFSMWTSHPDFMSIVQRAWDTHVEGSSMFRLCQKLKAVKLALKAWNKFTYGDIHQKIMHARGKIKSLQLQLQMTPNDTSLIREEKLVREEYTQALQAEESFAKQKSKQHWLSFGDSNTKFFYASMAALQALNTIRTCKAEDGTLIEDENDVRSHALHYYYSLLNQHFDRMEADVLPRNHLSHEEATAICSPFKDEDIKKVVMSSPKNKSPGPSEFFQHCWPIVGNLVIEAVQSFFSEGGLLKQLNSTFLIPKTDGADCLDQYRPISLCNFIYKVITKLISNRLQATLPSLIHPAQTAFLKGRSIHHNILLANDLMKDIHSRHKGKQICLKADLKKAFDSISRPFFYYMMERMGFPPLFISWVRCCLESAKFSLLFNGSPIGFFGSSNGIRQGDPFSPYLFTIAMEGLSCLIEEEVRNGDLRVPSYGDVHVSHILFADDLIIFFKDDLTSSQRVASLLHRFSHYSGLRLNNDKSRVYIGARVMHRTMILENLQVKEGDLPTPYLGLPLISSALKKPHCQPIINKIKKRFESWRTRLL